MNNPFFSNVRAGLSAAVFAFAGLALTSSAHAQSTIIKVNVPFAFENGSEHMPSGKYTIQLDENSHLLVIRGSSANGMSLTQPEENRAEVKTGKVVFHRYGDKYFLREVWVAGYSNHIETPNTGAEKRARMELAQNPTEPNGTEVALLEQPR